MNATERAELRELCERAGGPLDVHDYGSHWLINNDEWGVSVPANAGEANATLFAAARTVIPRLLDALERKDAALREAMEWNWLDDDMPATVARTIRAALDAPATPPDQGPSLGGRGERR